MITNINEILGKYTLGELTAEETNKSLAEVKANVRIDPNKNKLTPEEIKSGSSGLLDTGTGTLDKVQIKGNKLVNVDLGSSVAFVIVGGKTYKVNGDTIVK